MKTLPLLILLSLGMVLTQEMKGINFVGMPYTRVSLSDYRAILALEHLSTTGAEWISIPITLFQDFKNSSLSYRASQLFITDTHINESPADKDLNTILQEAKKLNLKVQLQFQVSINQANWPNSRQIGQNWAPWNAKIWFDRYLQNILEYIKPLESIGIDMISLGHNMFSVSLYENEWRNLIASVRNHTSAKLTYSAAFGDEDRNSGFWDDLDYISVFPKFNAVTVKDFTQQMHNFERSILYLNKVWKKPVIISKVHACANPNRVVTQRLLFGALHDLYLAHPSVIQGIFFGDWAADVLYSIDTEDDFSYLVQGGDSEGIVRQLYQGEAREIEKPEGVVNYRYKCECKTVYNEGAASAVGYKDDFDQE